MALHYNRWQELLKFIADGTSQYGAVFDIRTYTTAMIACHEAQQWQKVTAYHNIIIAYTTHYCHSCAYMLRF
jgi:hypothetical protein